MQLHSDLRTLTDESKEIPKLVKEKCSNILKHITLFFKTESWAGL